MSNQRFMRRFGGGCLLTASLAIFSQLGFASTDQQRVTREDYARAEALLPANTFSLMLNERVIPRWIGGRDEFWYRRETTTGHEFVIVDAATGRKRPAFDHRALAAALSELTRQPASAEKLPFHSLTPISDRQLTKIRFTVAAKDYTCTLQVVRCEVSTQDVAARSVAEGAIRSPDGNWETFTRDNNLWLRNIGSGREQPLTTDGEPDFGYGITPDGWKAAYIPRERAGKPQPPFDSYWSPDSKRFVVSRLDQRHVAEYPFIESAPADGSFRPKLHTVRIPLVGEKPASVEWFAFDIPSGAHRRIEYPYSGLLALQQDMLPLRKTWWHSSNGHLYSVAFGDNMESAFVFDSDLATGNVRTVIEERLEPRTDLNTTSYNPPNVHVSKDGREVVWFSVRDGWGHLYLYDGGTGRLKNQITRGNWLVRDIVHVDERQRRIYFTGSGREPGDPYHRYLYRVSFDGSDLQLLSPEAGDHLLTSPANDVLAMDGAAGYDVVSPSGKYVVYNVSAIEQPPRTVIRSTADAKLVATFEQADASRLLAAGYRAPEPFVAKAADGKSDVHGVIYKPTDFDPRRKYPVIDFQYASPLTAVVPHNFVQSLRVAGYGSPASTAQLGFVVVVVDARGTSYRSREFSQYGYGKLNINGLDDHVAAIRQLAERHSYIDAERVGIVGGSYGGWSALRGLLEFPDFYKASVAGVAPGSFHSMYLDYHWTTFQGRPQYQGGGELRPSSADVPTNWQALDGPKQADRLQGKLLMIVGEVDENVPPGSSLQFVDALIKANKDFELLYMPNTNHGGNGPYITRRVWDFFVRHLKNQEPPSLRQ